MKKYVVIEDSQNLAMVNAESDSIYRIRAVAICDSDEDAIAKAVEAVKEQKAYMIRGGWRKFSMNFHDNGVCITAFGESRTWTCRYMISTVNG